MTSVEPDAIGVAKLAAFVVLSALGAWISFQNWRCFWQGHVRREHTASWTPLFGAVLVTLGLLCSPWPAVRALWWLPFLLDWGSAPGLVYTAAWHLRRLRGRGDA